MLENVPFYLEIFPGNTRTDKMYSLNKWLWIKTSAKSTDVNVCLQTHKRDWTITGHLIPVIGFKSNTHTQMRPAFHIAIPVVFLSLAELNQTQSVPAQSFRASAE